MTAPDPLSLLDTERPTHLGAGESAGVQPFSLRRSSVAPPSVVPHYSFDPELQVAVDTDGRPLTPELAKSWTTVEGTHTDGDGGDNEMWGWEEK